MHRPALAVFLLLFGIYMLTASGHFYAVDEERMFEVTGSLARYGSFALNPEQNDQPPQYSQYGPGQSIAALPLYYLGKLIATLYPPEAEAFVLRAVAGWFNPFVTAAIGALLVVAVRRLGYSSRTGVYVALLYGLATTAWPHSKTFFAEPLVALLLFGSFVLMGEPRTKNREQRTSFASETSSPFSVLRSPFFVLFLSGLLAGLAPTVKIQSAIFLPILGLWVLAIVWQGRTQHAVASLGAYCLGAALPLTLLAWYQWAAFGHPLRTGYGGNVLADFSTPFLQGLAGLLLSPGRGLFWYAPITLLVPIALLLLARRHGGIALLCAAIIVAHLVFYAKWIAWDGAGAWGPRFLNSALPFMLLPFAALVDERRKTKDERGKTTSDRRSLRPSSFVLRLLLLLTIPVQLAGLAINFNAFFAQLNYRQPDDYRLSESAIVGHWAMFTRQLQTHYEVLFAPGVALEGVANTEGAGQLPRWAGPAAQIVLRPPPARTVQVELDLSSCWMEPDPQPLTLLLNGTALLRKTTACPARRYHLLLPGGRNVLSLQTTGWRPAEFGIAKEGELGVYLHNLRADADGVALPIYGYRLPITPMPESSSGQRRWAGDYRFGHWDFWWWYLYHSGWPARANTLLAVLWLALAGGALVSGILFMKGRTINR
jgi:hypothetical protein